MEKTDRASRRPEGGAPSAGRQRALFCALVVALMLAGQRGVAAERDLPEDTRAMTGVELYMLYRDRSWQWSDGAGRMQDEGRVFKAWSGSGATAFWAEGRWIVTDTGRLCLQADWHGQADTFEDRTCFSHRTDGQAIFQKKEPSGAWYVFRHAKPQEGDEFMKLVREDLVSPKLEALRNPPRQEQDADTARMHSLNSEAKGDVR